MKTVARDSLRDDRMMDRRPSRKQRKIDHERKRSERSEAARERKAFLRRDGGTWVVGHHHAGEPSAVPSRRAG